MSPFPPFPDALRLDRRPLRSALVAGSALALALALAGLPSCAPQKAGAKFPMPPAPVEVSQVRPQIVRDEFRAIGTIEAEETIEVVSEINAVVKELPFAEGQAVAAGALIARLDDGELAADAARAAAQHEQAKINTARGKKLAEQDLISGQELDNLGLALKVAEAGDRLAQARLAKTRIRAPFAGLTGRRRVSPGAYLRAGDLITELARLDQVKVAFSAPERFLAEIKRGAIVMVTTPAYPAARFEGRVSVVDPIVDPQSRSVQLVARIPNPDRRLLPGMSANASVTFAQRDRALTVPDEAVFAEGDQSFVYVVKPDSSVTRTAIQLGTRDSSRVEVVHGLEAGAVVVRTGHQKLYEGAKVMPVPDSTAPAARAS